MRRPISDGNGTGAMSWFIFGILPVYEAWLTPFLQACVQRSPVV